MRDALGRAMRIRSCLLVVLALVASTGCRRKQIEGRTEPVTSPPAVAEDAVGTTSTTGAEIVPVTPVAPYTPGIPVELLPDAPEPVTQPGPVAPPEPTADVGQTSPPPAAVAPDVPLLPEPAQAEPPPYRAPSAADRTPWIGGSNNTSARP